MNIIGFYWKLDITTLLVSRFLRLLVTGFSTMFGRLKTSWLNWYFALDCTSFSLIELINLSLFMYSYCLFVKTWFSCCFIITYVTWITNSFMYSWIMFVKTWFSCCFVITYNTWAIILICSSCIFDSYYQCLVKFIFCVHWKVIIFFGFYNFDALINLPC